MHAECCVAYPQLCSSTPTVALYPASLEGKEVENYAKWRNQGRLRKVAQTTSSVTFWQNNVWVNCCHDNCPTAPRLKYPRLGCAEDQPYSHSETVQCCLRGCAAMVHVGRIKTGGKRWCSSSWSHGCIRNSYFSVFISQVIQTN